MTASAIRYRFTLPDIECSETAWHGQVTADEVADETGHNRYELLHTFFDHDDIGVTIEVLDVDGNVLSAVELEPEVAA